MRHEAFIDLLVQIKGLTPRQRQVVAHRLKGHGSQVVVAPLGVLPDTIVCPHCQASGDRIGGWDQAQGLKRYRCKDCGRTFNALTGTALSRLRKRDQWGRYAEALIGGATLRSAAKQCAIDKNTAFLWRHRFLHYAASHRAAHESGIVEADETFFLESFKGQRCLLRAARHRGGVASKRGINAEQIPVLVVRDRSGQTADFKLAKLDAAHVMSKLQPLIDRESLLYTDCAGVHAAFARATGIAHRTINVRHGPRVIDGVFHIQNVNAYDSRLKGWMRRFQGVAAKYLENYLG